MITQKVTKAKLDKWKNIWLQYRDTLKPNKKSGVELLEYLQNNYILKEIYDQFILDTILYNVTKNIHYTEKLPRGVVPSPRAFLLENVGINKKLYCNKETSDEEITKIFVGIDMESSFYMVEGCTMLFDEICAFIGLDEKDLENYVCVAQYISSLNIVGKLEEVLNSY